VLSELTQRLDRHGYARLKAVTKIQTRALRAIHEYFAEQDFLQLMPVILSRLTDPVTDGKRPQLVPAKIDYHGRQLKLTQSMILHKQLAIGSGLDRFYIMSPNVRLETPESYYTGQHLYEFSQVDFELADAEMEDIFRFVEGLLHRIKDDVASYATHELAELNRYFKPWSKRFPVYSSHEIYDEFGPGWEIEASRVHDTPFWVTCMNRHFYDKTEDIAGTTHYLNYELIYPQGFGAALSGSVREVDFVRLVDRMVELGLSRYEYSAYLLRAQAGLLAPSAGAGLGVERLVRYLTGIRHIGDIQLFRRVPGEDIEL
jgi:asparaginyl-tRNA synthetase